MINTLVWINRHVPNLFTASEFWTHAISTATVVVRTNDKYYNLLQVFTRSYFDRVRERGGYALKTSSRYYVETEWGRGRSNTIWSNSKERMIHSRLLQVYENIVTFLLIRCFQFMINWRSLVELPFLRYPNSREICRSHPVYFLSSFCVLIVYFTRKHRSWSVFILCYFALWMKFSKWLRNNDAWDQAPIVAYLHRR